MKKFDRCMNASSSSSECNLRVLVEVMKEDRRLDLPAAAAVSERLLESFGKRGRLAAAIINNINPSDPVVVAGSSDVDRQGKPKQPATRVHLQARPGFGEAWFGAWVCRFGAEPTSRAT